MPQELQRSNKIYQGKGLTLSSPHLLKPKVIILDEEEETIEIDNEISMAIEQYFGSGLLGAPLICSVTMAANGPMCR